jgi:hypothetical protein
MSICTVINGEGKKVPAFPKLEKKKLKDPDTGEEKEYDILTCEGAKCLRTENEEVCEVGIYKTTIKIHDEETDDSWEIEVEIPVCKCPRKAGGKKRGK